MLPDDFSGYMLLMFWNHYVHNIPTAPEYKSWYVSSWEISQKFLSGKADIWQALAGSGHEFSRGF